MNSDRVARESSASPRACCRATVAAAAGLKAQLAAVERQYPILEGEADFAKVPFAWRGGSVSQLRCTDPMRSAGARLAL